MQMAASNSQRNHRKRILFQSLDDIRTNDFDVESASGSLGKILSRKKKRHTKSPATGREEKIVDKKESLIVPASSVDQEEMSPSSCRSLFAGLRLRESRPN